MSLDPNGSWEVKLTFSPDGELTQRVTMYGLYPGNSAGERSFESVVSGTYSVEGTQLSTSPSSYQWWDQFYEDPGPHTGEPPATLYPDCTFEIEGFILTLHYTSYPADAPVATERSFYRFR